ncbi:Hypothetical predicted protein, partial [Pelobates cultripes]
METVMSENTLPSEPRITQMQPLLISGYCCCVHNSTPAEVMSLNAGMVAATIFGRSDLCKEIRSK